MARSPEIDPGSAAALVALLAEGGPWAVVVVVLGLVLRAWRSGEFISKAVHDQIVEATRQRYTDLLDRFNNQQAALEKWRGQAEQGTGLAAAAQTQYAELQRRVEALQTELAVIHRGLEEFKDDFHGARVWRELGPPPAPAAPPDARPHPRRPGAPEGD